jgi:hypothetical protein
VEPTWTGLVEPLEKISDAYTGLGVLLVISWV